MNAGMNAHLAKTMRPERLYEILEEYLSIPESENLLILASLRRAHDPGASG